MEFLGITTLVFFFIWRGYWWITEQKADKEKPKTQERPRMFTYRRASHWFVLFVGGTVSFQLLGLSLWPMTTNFSLQILGLVMVICGLGIAMVARHQLGTNWANGYEYQIKKKQTLVTKGIYAYIRNPIYSGLMLSVLGAELVVHSYLFFVLLVLLFGAGYTQSKMEEKILEEHFGKEYREYKKRTKMLIPFVL